MKVIEFYRADGKKATIWKREELTTQAERDIEFSVDGMIYDYLVVFKQCMDGAWVVFAKGRFNTMEEARLSSVNYVRI